MIHMGKYYDGSDAWCDQCGSTRDVEFDIDLDGDSVAICAACDVDETDEEADDDDQ